MFKRSDNQQRYQTNLTKMPVETDLGTRKTLFVLVIVVGCFAVLWPKVFYPMLVGPTSQRMKPNHLDKGCCDVISDIDLNTIKIMTELCNSIVHNSNEKPLKQQDIIKQCRTEIYNKCGIDISLILQEQVRLGRSFKQIVDEVRSFNGSFCLKYQFGLSPSKLGVSHRVTINLSPVYVKQERPSHLRPEMLHPALRERGSAIVQPYQPPVKPGHPTSVEGRPGPVPGIRPPMGGAAHMVHSPKGSNSMGVIMPIYTIGIVIFFSYTLMKLLFKKKPEGPGAPLYPPVEPSITFKKEVFESQKAKSPQGPLIVNAMTALLDEVDQELEARRKARELVSQKDLSNGGLPEEVENGCAKQPPEHDQPTVKILGMEMTASCEGGKKWDRCESPVIPKSQFPPELTEPPQEIFLGGTLPAQSQLLVTDSVVEEEANSLSSSADPPVILASKMTLSVISLDAPENEESKENKAIDQSALEDIIDESKYTTASGITAAECDISDEEASDIVDEVEKNLLSDTMHINTDLYIDSKQELETKILDNSIKTPNNVQEIASDAEKEKNNDYLIPEVHKTVENVNDNVIDCMGKVVEDFTTVQDNINEQIASIEGIKDEIDQTLENVLDRSPESIQNLDVGYLPENIENVVDADKTNQVSIKNKEVKDDEDRGEDNEDTGEDEDKDNSDEIEEECEELDSDVEEIEDMHDDTDANSLDDELNPDEIEEIIIFEDEIDVDDNDNGNDRVHVFISNDNVENIGNIIDEIITDGARRLDINDIENNVIVDDLEHSVGHIFEAVDNEANRQNIDSFVYHTDNYNLSGVDNCNDLEKEAIKSDTVEQN